MGKIECFFPARFFDVAHVAELVDALDSGSRLASFWCFSHLCKTLVFSMLCRFYFSAVGAALRGFSGFLGFRV
jgi:hypothetical protein